MLLIKKNSYNLNTLNHTIGLAEILRTLKCVMTRRRAVMQKIIHLTVTANRNFSIFIDNLYKMSNVIRI